MKTEWKDVAGMYLVCEVLMLSEPESKEPNIKKLVGIHTDYTNTTWYHLCNNEYIQKVEIAQFKPLLRKLSDMTEAEMKELYQIVFGKTFVGDNITHRDIGKKDERWVLWSGVERLFIYKEGDIGADSDLHYYSVHQPTVIKWLLSKHFDLFSLIPNGYAIDRTTLPSLSNK